MFGSKKRAETVTRLATQVVHAEQDAAIARANSARLTMDPEKGAAAHYATAGRASIDSEATYHTRVAERYELLRHEAAVRGETEALRVYLRSDLDAGLRGAKLRLDEVKNAGGGDYATAYWRTLVERYGKALEAEQKAAIGERRDADLGGMEWTRRRDGSLQLEGPGWEGVVDTEGTFTGTAIDRRAEMHALDLFYREKIFGGEIKRSHFTWTGRPVDKGEAGAKIREDASRGDQAIEEDWTAVSEVSTSALVDVPMPKRITASQMPAYKAGYTVGRIEQCWDEFRGTPVEAEVEPQHDLLNDVVEAIRADARETEDPVQVRLAFVVKEVAERLGLTGEDGKPIVMSIGGTDEQLAELGRRLDDAMKDLAVHKSVYSNALIAALNAQYSEGYDKATARADAKIAQLQERVDHRGERISEMSALIAKQSAELKVVHEQRDALRPNVKFASGGRVEGPRSNPVLVQGDSVDCVVPVSETIAKIQEKLSATVEGFLRPSSPRERLLDEVRAEVNAVVPEVNRRRELAKLRLELNGVKAALRRAEQQRTKSAAKAFKKGLARGRRQAAAIRDAEVRELRLNEATVMLPAPTQGFQEWLDSVATTPGVIAVDIPEPQKPETD